MAWTSMHFAVGMACTGAAGLATCWVLNRGWRWVPALMTVGGIWGLAPDLPRLWREDFPWLPLAGILGSRSLEAQLHQWGDWFFLHRQLDAQPHQYALHGLLAIVGLYNLALLGLMWMEAIQRNSPANRAWRNHRSLRKSSRPHQTVERELRHRRHNERPALRLVQRNLDQSA